MSLREIFRHPSVDTLLGLPPSELLSLIVLCVIAVSAAALAAGLLMKLASR